MFENTARPEGGGLLKFRNADAFAPHIFRLLDPGIFANNDPVLKKMMGGKDRYTHPAVIPASERLDQRRERHLGYIKIAEFKLTPEHL